MDYEKQFCVQQRTRILELFNKILSRGNSVANSQGWNPHIAGPSEAWYRRSETLAVWQSATRPTVVHVWLPEHEQAFRTWGLVWNSHHESPPDGCHRKWGFSGVMWRESFIATRNCFHTECRFARLKARPTRTKAINFARVSANGSRITPSLGRSSLQWRGTFPLDWANK